jgi:pimeloyl-ACP methyl ester carboxylesterase
MDTIRNIALVASVSLGLVAASASSAQAGGFNDRSCKPAPGQYPVVLVHGQGGDVNMMTGVSGALTQAGYCVFGTNYGFSNGANGREYLGVSAQQIKDFTEGVLKDTGAAKVNVVGHSAGTGVLDNYIMTKGGAEKVNRLVSFAGLHHPYAHGGLPGILDADIYLPNLIAMARKVVPGVKVADLVKTAMDVAKIGGGSLGGINPSDIELATSNFVADLFDPAYWETLQGGQSETDGVYAKVSSGVRSSKTKDAAPNVCYTNLVSMGDMMVGGSAGFQDQAPNVENVVLQSFADHTAILGDQGALAKMISGLAAPCAMGASTVPVGGTEGFDGTGSGKSHQQDGEDDDDGMAPPEAGGCSVGAAASSTKAGDAAALMAGLLAWVSRRRRRAAQSSKQ